MNILADLFQDGNKLMESISDFIDKYIGASLLRRCNITKIVDTVEKEDVSTYPDTPLSRLLGNSKKSQLLEKCVSAKKLLLDKILIGFSSMSAYMMFKLDEFFGDYKKDTFYRFDLLPKANWERLQSETAANVIADLEARTEEEHIRALIFDDSLYRRAGGKRTELCCKVYDHNDRKTRLGYRMMTSAWSNGDVIVPIQQCLLTTNNPELMVGPDEDYDRRTIRGRRRTYAKETGTTSVLRMIRNAKDAGIPFSYVLFDTWFSSPSEVMAVHSLETDVVAMVKKGATKYAFRDPETGEERKEDLKTIFDIHKKRRGRSRYLLSVNVTLTSDDGESIPAKLIYARNRNKRNEYVCFICTDMELDEETALLIYTVRWKIETYFKITKSYLKLRTECHSTSYDALTAHMVVVALRHMMLTLQRFNNTDDRSIEEIFNEAKRQVYADYAFSAVTTIIEALFDCIEECFKPSEEKMKEFAFAFVDKLPYYWRSRLVSSAVAA